LCVGRYFIRVESNCSSKTPKNQHETVHNTALDSNIKPLKYQYQTTTSNYEKFAPKALEHQKFAANCTKNSTETALNYTKTAPKNITKLPQTAQKQHQT